jgi:HAD superfamily hydrolase (TIGR01509 family)
MAKNDKIIKYKDLLVKPGKKIKLKDFSTKYEGKNLNKQEAEQILENSRKKLAEIQDELYAHNQYSVLIIFQAMDAAGKDEIRKARDMRLQLREVRIASEKRRKALKEDSLRRGQAIDKVAKVITQIAEPAEAKLLEMETIAERLEAERKARVRAERVMQLAPFGVDTTCIDLAGMEDAAFARLLEGSRLASEARERAKREAEEKRAADEAARKAEADRLKAENERLRKENEKREADARAARAEADRKLREEREAREKLEREDAERKRVEAKRLADEAKAKRKADRAPDAAKVRAIVAQLESIKDPGFLQEMINRKLLPQVHYDAIIDSSQIGAIKPEAAMYDAAIKASGVQSSEILLIDDDRMNLMAAEKLGWHVMWFDDYHASENQARIKQTLAY